MARTAKKKELSPEEKLAAALVPENEQPYKVPENWCWCKVGTVCSLHRGVSYKKNEAHSIKQENDCLIMRGGNIGEGYIDTEADNIYVDMSLVNEEQLVKENDIIIVASTGSSKVIGRAGISLNNYFDVAFGAFLMLARPNGRAFPRFVDYYFQSVLYRNRIRDLANGVNINNIRANYITETPIPLPPLPEQQRIVNLIESLFADLDEAKEKLTTIMDGFAQRKAAILHRAFTGELTEKWREENGVGLESWRKTTLMQITYTIGDGLHGTPTYDDEGNFFFINGNNFIDGHIEIKVDTKRVNEQEYEKYRTDLSEENTVFLSINGTLGRTAFYNGEPIILGKSACYVNTLPILEKCFLRYFFHTLEFINYANERATGSTIKNLGLKAIREKSILLPSIHEQKEIVRILDEIFAKEQQAQSVVESVLADIELLKKSILARAFRGELGTGNPEDERAEDLLKRVL